MVFREPDFARSLNKLTRLNDERNIAGYIPAVILVIITTANKLPIKLISSKFISIQLPAY